MPGELSAEAILASPGHGLYVQSISGLHSGTNPVSGDFSVGAVGLVVRDGALAEPVRELPIASTLPRMLHDVLQVGPDLIWLPGVAPRSQVPTSRRADQPSRRKHRSPTINVVGPKG